jgi:hypothetical protein
MTEKPAKTSKAVVKAATSAKPAKPAEKVTVSRARTARRRTPHHDEIAERAYFIHLEERMTDDVGNWLRAERELKAA